MAVQISISEHIRDGVDAVLKTKVNMARIHVVDEAGMPLGGGYVVYEKDPKLGRYFITRSMATECFIANTERTSDEDDLSSVSGRSLDDFIKHYNQ